MNEIIAVNEIIEFLWQHGVMLLAGSSLLLAVGSLGLLVQRSPIQRQRLGELTIVCVLAWLVLACVPLPRYLADRLKTSSTAATAGLSSGEAEVAVPVLYFGPDATLAERRQRIDEALANLDEPATGELAPSAAFLDPAPMSESTMAVASILAASAEPTDFDSLSSRPGATAGLPSSAVEIDDVSSAPSPQPSPVRPSSPLATGGGSSLELADVLPWLFLAGCAASVAWLALGQVLLMRLRRTAVPIEPWLERLYESLPMAGGQQRPRLLVTRQRGQAMSWGIWRPTIAVSAELCRPKFTEQLRHVLLHELAHIAQRDARGTLLFNVAFIVLYFHPLYWWLRAKVRFAGELIADDWAVAHSSPDRYAEELMSIVRGFRGGFRHLQAMTIFRSPTQFYRRMNMLLERENPLATGCPRWWTIAYGLVCVAGVGLAAAMAGVAPAGESQPPDDQVVASEASIQEESEEVEETTTIDDAIAEAADAAGEIADDVAESIAEAMDGSHAALEAIAQSQAALEEGRRMVDAKLANALAMLGKVTIMPDVLIDVEIAKDPRIVALETKLGEAQSQLAALRNFVRNPDRDPGAQSLAASIGTMQSQLEDRRQELRGAIRQMSRLELAQKGSGDVSERAKRADDDRQALEDERRALDQQRRKIEEKMRDLEAKGREVREKAKSVREKSDDRGDKEPDDKLRDEKGDKESQKIKDAGKKAAEEAQRATEKAAAKAAEAAKRAAEEGRKAAAEAKRRVGEKIAREKRELAMKKGEIAIEERRESDSQARELKEAKEQLSRQVKELEEAKAKLGREIQQMRRDVEQLQKKIKSGAAEVPAETEKPNRRPAKPSSQPKEVRSDQNSDSTAATAPGSEVPSVSPAAATIPKVAALLVSAPTPPETPATPVSPPTLAPPATPVAPLAEPAPDAPQVAQRPQRPQTQQAEAPLQQSRSGAVVAPSSAVRSRASADPVGLAKEYSDALSHLEGAIVEVNGAKQLVKQGGAPADRVERAQAEVKRAQRRITLLRTIAQGELDKAEADLESTETALKEGKGSKSDRAAALTKVRLLKLILDEQPPALSQSTLSLEADTVAIDGATPAVKGTDHQAGEVRVFRLRHAQAGDAETAINRLFGDGKTDLRTSKEERTNSVIVRASADTLKQVEQLIKRLDDGEDAKSVR